MNRIVLAAAVLLSVFAGGCGAEPLEEADEIGEEMMSQELTVPKIPNCDTSQDWILRYYSNASKTTQVGLLFCSCGLLTSNGQKTTTATLSTFLACTI